MKNLKIGAKIMLCFGVVIVFMLIMTVTVVITNQSSSNNLRTIDAISVFQADANAFLNHYDGAQINAETLNAGTDEQAYNNIVSYYNNMERVIDELIRQSAITPELRGYTDDLQYIKGEVSEWMALINELREVNARVDSIRLRLAETGALATEITRGLYMTQLDNLENDIRAETDTGAMLRRRGRVQHGADITMAVDTMRLAFSRLIYLLDMSGLEGAAAQIDALNESTDLFTADSTQQTDRDAGNAAKAALDSYIAQVTDIFNEANEMQRIRTELDAISDYIDTVINNTLDAIDATVSQIIDSAETSGMTSQIIAIIISAVALVFAVLMALTLTRSINAPIKAMSGFFAHAGSTGDIVLAPEQQKMIGNLALRKDEIGDLSKGASSFIGHVTVAAEELGSIAQGDLTIDIKVLSDKDVLGTALQSTINNLNNMFGEINSATAQVNTGSKQIADGAQSLAQGSTEQASSIQQLSSSIAEVAERTKANAETANKTSQLSNTIKDNAEKGSRQMDEMITAVDEINEASKNISKIIKTIDDIAFQTNILALNAAVEAARAGQHGKGFAVVAEEVRNLASKSAEAAKDTGGMIQTSMEKAELGSRIAGETAASLSGIVSGINESSQLIAEIAKGSEEQTQGITQINIGIDQVAQVVQQNSATAEESAAASQEMSGQSDILQQLIAQFKLKNSGGMYRSLPPAGSAAPTQPEAPALSAGGGDFGKY